MYSSKQLKQNCCSLLLAAWLLTTFVPVQAQTVRWEKTGFGSIRHRADRIAEAQNRADWPRVADGDPGTQVHISFDLRNADILLITSRPFGQQPLLAQARHIAPAIGCPKADYILFTGTQTVTTDIELNKYLVQPTRQHTESNLNLAALADTLRASALPRPIVLFVRANEANEALLIQPKTAPRRLGDATFLGLTEVPAGARLHFAASIPWYAPWVDLALAGATLWGIVSGFLLPWRMAQKRTRLADQAGRSPLLSLEVPSPEEVQQRYNQHGLRRLLPILMPLSVLLLSHFSTPDLLLTSILYSLPFDIHALDSRTVFFLPLGMGGLMGLSFLVFSLTEQRRIKNGKEPLLPVQGNDPDAPPAWTTSWFVLVLGIAGVPLMLLPILLINGLIPHGPWIHTLPFVLPGVLLVALAIGGWSAARAVRTEMPPEDPWYQMVSTVAREANVEVKRVVRIQSPSVNAYASLFGTVGLTAGLLRKLDPEEVHVIIAHEIGHLRDGHVRRGFVVSLVGLASIWGLWWLGLHAIKNQLSDYTYALWSGPLVSIYLLPLLLNLLLGRGRRQHETAADRFAVEVTGDPERVIRVLTKLYTLNATPHQLKRSDEILSSHPSLVNRIAAIRSLPHANSTERH